MLTYRDLTTQERRALDREPQLHVSYDNHVPWLLIGEDGLKRMGDLGG